MIGISDSAKQEPRAQATGRFTIAAFLFTLTFMAGCASSPSFPDPKPGEGQIVVNLQGEPREGVEGPTRRSVQGEYTSTSESVEQGKAFERVDYDEIEDVVVIVEGSMARRTLSDVPIKLVTDTVVVTDDGFDRTQYATGPGISYGESTTSLEFRNERSESLLIYGFSETGSFEVSLPANGTAKVAVIIDGVYQVYCEEDEDLHCTWYAVTQGRLWIGSSDEPAFFDHLPPGEYDVTVYPPRLPAHSETITVRGGKRETVTAKLTVNDLPEVSE